MARTLGRIQLGILGEIARVRGTWNRRTSGWHWDGPGATERRCETLAKRGLLHRDGDTFVITIAGRELAGPQPHATEQQRTWGVEPVEAV
jgi:hypothetical protein